MARARASFKLLDRDKGYERIVEELKELGHGGAFVKVGLMGELKDSHQGEEFTSVDIGLVHEFGSPAAGIPERSWLRSACDKYQDDWNALRLRLVRLVYDGKLDIETALGLMGERAAADVKAHITDGPEIPPPNAPSVLERKQAKGTAGGDVRTLVDSGRFVGDITYQVVMGEGGGHE